jgi:hypothetical protein
MHFSSPSCIPHALPIPSTLTIAQVMIG